MLSPNATIREALREGGLATATLKLHDAVRWRASVTVHETVVVPTGKVLPLGSEHVVLTGAAPPLTVGALYVTGIGLPVGDVRATGAGHESCGASGVGGAGPPQPAMNSASAATPR
jgi:hypothetical protein